MLDIWIDATLYRIISVGLAVAQWSLACWNKADLTWIPKILIGLDDNKVLKLQLVLLMIILVSRIIS
jgi:hypothetical protein